MDSESEVSTKMTQFAITKNGESEVFIITAETIWDAVRIFGTDWYPDSVDSLIVMPVVGGGYADES